MPKMKTRKAFAKKFKVTGTGKLLRRRPGKRHILAKKSTKRKRALGQPAVVTEPQASMFKRWINP